MKCLVARGEGVERAVPKKGIDVGEDGRFGSINTLEGLTGRQPMAGNALW